MPTFFRAGFVGFLCVAAAELGSLLLADAKSSVRIEQAARWISRRLPSF
jgi:hypothetical protein